MKAALIYNMNNPIEVFSYKAAMEGPKLREAVDQFLSTLISDISNGSGKDESPLSGALHYQRIDLYNQLSRQLQERGLSVKGPL